MLFLGDGDEISKMPELHVPYPIDMNIIIIILWIDGPVKAMDAPNRGKE
jgi:hypothetical protein